MNFASLQQLLQTTDTTSLVLLVVAFLAACAFEFVNGFHDTANAVATVIYTKSLKPWQAVTWSGICNFLGVFLGGTAVAMGILKLLPPELMAAQDVSVSLAMVFALLIAAILWNLGTWFLGLPASSSHTLIGAILGIGLANAVYSGGSWVSGVNWLKAREIGLALIISPLLGFALAGGLCALARRFLNDPVLHSPPVEGETPPLKARIPLILTSTGVSLAHGSNDGQKGVGLIMLILITLLPGHFAVKSDDTGEVRMAAQTAARSIVTKLEAPMNPQFRVADGGKQGNSKSWVVKTLQSSAYANEPGAAPANEAIQSLERLAQDLESGQADPFSLRTQILKIDQRLGSLEKKHDPMFNQVDWKAVKMERERLRGLTDYAPFWVLMAVAISLGLGTMIGWKRIVVTIGEKIGKAHLTYAQGVSAEVVAMSTIGISAAAGLPVSTTHILSSGVAGTMVAGQSGVNSKTVRNIALAWILTLPASMALSAGLFMVFLKIFA